MPIISFKKGIKQRLSKNFTTAEFDCSCDKCDRTLIDNDLIELLEDLRAEVNLPLKITSGYRCAEHNVAIGGAPKSTHVDGMAADVTCKDLDKLYSCANDIFASLGDGRHKGFIHVDTRSDKKRRWTY